MDRLLGELTASQFAEWEAFHALEPFGPIRDEYRFATIAATVANAAPFRGKGAKAWRAGDFSEALAADRPKATPGEVTERLDCFFLSIGGKRP